MDFAFSDEQEALRAAARAFLDRHYPAERVGELADGKAGWDPGSWPELAARGWLGRSVPAAHGGSGGSVLDEAVLLEEAGRFLYPGPLFATLGLALPALVAGAAVDGAPLAAVLGGERAATLAWAEPGGPAAIGPQAAVGCVAQLLDDWRLTGAKRLVPDLAIADMAVVVARVAEDGGQRPAGDEVGLWLADLRADPSLVVERSTVDSTRRLGDLALDGTPATLLVPPERTAAVLAETRMRAFALLACEAVGVADHALGLAADHATSRHAWDRPIGTYQGISHRIADVYARTQLARSLAYWAAWSVAAGDERAPMACAAAKSAAGEAAVFATESAIQVYGGRGFLWSTPIHRWYKRALWIDAFTGHGAVHRRDLAAALLDRPAG
jgi:alkylation response protein AidB-like acyl-CoA dehydrogenase